MAPVVSDCPEDILLPFGSTVANWTEPMATDDSGQPVAVTRTHAPGTDFSGGNATVLYTFTDAAGNQENCSFDVRIGVGEFRSPAASSVRSCQVNVVRL